MTNISTDVGTLFVIIMGSLIGIGTVAMGITSYSINKQLDNANNNFNNFSKKQTETDETEEIDVTNDDEDTFTEDDLLDLNKNLSKYKGEDNEEYGINPGGWSVKKGGKHSKNKTNKKSNKNKKKSKKSKRKTSKK